jgi:hypothetical protein
VAKVMIIVGVEGLGIYSDTTCTWLVDDTWTYNFLEGEDDEIRYIQRHNNNNNNNNNDHQKQPRIEWLHHPFG